jgi:hypothetical protein
MCAAESVNFARGTRTHLPRRTTATKPRAISLRRCRGEIVSAPAASSILSSRGSADARGDP